MTDDTVRLNKHLAFVLGVSRREADELIEKGKVTVDGTIAELGAQVSPHSEIAISGKPISSGTKKEMFLFHKPVGYVCSRKAQGDNPTIYDLLPKTMHHLKPVGRLDKDSSGLLLLTNDGDLAHQMTHPSFQKAKVYQVELDRPLEPLHQQMISDFGVMLEDGKSKFAVTKLDQTVEPLATKSSGTSAARVSADANSTDTRREAVSEDFGSKEASMETLTYQIVMHEGRNRQIRRTFAALGYTVTVLHRTQFGPYILDDLQSGGYQPYS